MNELKRSAQLYNNTAAIVIQLRAAEAGIHRLTALAHVVTVAGSVKAPANIHEEKTRQERRNEISEGTKAAFDEVYELLQTKALTEEQLLLAEGYMVLARLAEVNEVLLRDAADEVVFEKLDDLEKANDKFEEATKQLEAEAREASAKS